MNTLLMKIKNMLKFPQVHEILDLEISTDPVKKVNVINKLPIPNCDFQFFKLLNLEKYDAVIAGGACLRWYQGFPVENHDIDLWFKTEERRKEFISYCMEMDDYTCEGYIDTENAITLILTNKISKYKVQTIKKIYNDIPDLLNTFDFSICKIATDSHRWFLGENFAQDLKNKKLVIEKCTEMTPKRFIKYWSYGFEPDIKTLETIRNFPNAKWTYTSQEQDGDY